MGLKVLAAAIHRAGSFFNLTSIDYGTVETAVDDIETRLEHLELRDKTGDGTESVLRGLVSGAETLAARVAVIEQQENRVAVESVKARLASLEAWAQTQRNALREPQGDATTGD